MIILSLENKPTSVSRASLGNYLRGISSVYFICLHKTLSIPQLKIEALLQEITFSSEMFPSGGDLFLFSDEYNFSDKTNPTSPISCLREIENSMPDFAEAIQMYDDGTNWRHSVSIQLLNDFFRSLTK